jgi:hypothetical protein
VDFGGFILFGFLTLGLLVGAVLVAVLFIKRSPACWRASILWLGGIAILTLFGRFLHQVYWLDEKLVIAVGAGNAAEVKALLSAGANPNAHWEDGTSALCIAKFGKHEDIVTLLQKAGAGE